MTKFQIMPNLTMSK